MSPTMLSRRSALQGVAAIGLLGLRPAPAQGQQVPVLGCIERLADFSSHHVESRHIEVWLPPDYEHQARAGKRFAVLYMHDGQMLFDARTTWNRQAWAMDVAAQRVTTGGVRDFLIVGAWSTGPLRHSEYFPAKFLPHLPASLRARYVRDALHGKPRSDDYLRFLVGELKPAIDARFATLPERGHCMLMGSSMGGLISAYALCEYPGVFGGAACLSTHWIATREANPEFPAAAQAYLAQALPRPQSVRFWTDRGTVDLDAQYVQAHARITTLLQARGYVSPHAVTRVVEGAGHSERAWAARAHEALQFLMA